uniref:hypothetical protein n=1 Tax=Oceanobacillus indicireducens TaxID=1004261 RepID=UPI00166D046F|nr:hypothetical protein [Oceanobacillus indicireducens]
MIRRFIKKGQPIHTYADDQIADVEDWMNTLTRNIRLSNTGRNVLEFVDYVT